MPVLENASNATLNRLEHYDWKKQEEYFNTLIPQFRTNITTSMSATPLRMHFIHARSPFYNAIPLLLIPPFPFTNLSLSHLINIFTEPNDAEFDQPFHLIIPALPGIGFSDALPSSTRVIPTIAEMLDSLMKRLMYDFYIVSNAAPCAGGVAEVDWKLIKYLSGHFSDSCLGAHIISPPFRPPEMLKSPVQWTRWKMANLFQTSIFGYSQDDFRAIQRRSKLQLQKQDSRGLSSFGFGGGSTCDPNILAYALCDSPTGLLVFILTLLKAMSSGRDFSPAEVITMAQLTWLPGPEATMRLWAHCASSTEEQLETEPARRIRTAVTVFLCKEEGNQEQQTPEPIIPSPASLEAYACPAWANQEHEVIWSKRVLGTPGLLAWEQPEIIAAGARGLARSLMAIDKRLRAPELPGVTILEQVIVHGNVIAPAELSGTTVQDTIEGPKSPLPVISPS